MKAGAPDHDAVTESDVEDVDAKPNVDGAAVVVVGAAVVVVGAAVVVVAGVQSIDGTEEFCPC